MSAFTAIILVCQLSTPPQACDETHAVDVISTQVENQFACLHGGQDVMARGALREGIGETLYIKTMCRKNAQAASLLQR
ncbi:hypothetical protein CCR94_07100 [Rhodoblastus sphagnicola]|uniref:Ribosomal protein S27 n=1 Tax=Rhodoblastus sphagnicola TaxID=333368 RepID=A0A2S6NC37_9HYPH|nr:hypothetical protein [Rhodoblastus sphagnicola]MBB4197474.1 hypothetical protein [Rhodoblastus sphagnicola]PPQ32176.1 hypothetical protein CCR94_07100 [Rhodoblastus sphagnicola]